ncbi:MAG: zinc ribbon domain-containing protein [Dehalococcoidales bacterium]|nr:zinc ribbon domain-containing protein [Dehalococcoidales bacterium]
MAYCSKCGREVTSKMTYCPACGKKLAIPNEDTVSMPQNPTIAEAIESGKIQLLNSHQQPSRDDSPLKQRAQDNTSGQGRLAEVPREIEGWNWGAFLLGWIWGVGNNTYISFLTLIPFIGIIVAFVLGTRGNEWAWRNRRWDSIKHFKVAQKNWADAGIIFYAIALVVIGGIYLGRGCSL